MREQHMIITGGTGALGAAVTEHFLSLGARVTVPFFSGAEADALRARVGSAADRLTLVEADLRAEEDVQRVCEAAPTLHALVHLMGGFMMGPLPEVSLERFRGHMDLNVTATFLLLKHCLPRMRAGGYGRIVTVSSQAALSPGKDLAVYAASKAAVLTMTKAVAEETRGEDITANVILPTIIDTPQNRAAMGDADAGTWLKPEKLARVIAFLASKDAGDQRGTTVTF